MSSVFWPFIAGIAIGLIIGFMWGESREHALWLDAVCGRRRIAGRREDL